MQVKMQKLTLTIAAAVIMTVAGVALSPGNAAAQNGEEFPVGEELPSFSDMDGDGVSDAMDMCPDTTIPERAVPRRRLLRGRYALTDDDTIFNTGRQRRRHRGRESDYTLADTRGCSCEQIIEMSGLGRSHRRFGCSREVMRVFTAAVDALPPAPEEAPAPEEQQCNTEEHTRNSENPILY